MILLHVVLGVFRIEADKRLKGATVSGRADMLREWEKMSKAQQLAKKIEHELSI